MEHGGVKVAARNTFLINPEGKIARVYMGVNPARHSDEVLKDLAVLKKELMRVSWLFDDLVGGKISRLRIKLVADAQ